MSGSAEDKRDQALLRIVGPIVRGQIRDFRGAHPDQLHSGFASSLAKRIINNLCRGSDVLRLRAALLVTATGGIVEGQDDNGCPDRGRSERFLGRPARRVTHRDWRGREGRVLAYARGYCWVAPPGMADKRRKRPLTYATDKLIFLDGEPAPIEPAEPAP